VVPREKRALVLDILMNATPEDLVDKSDNDATQGSVQLDPISNDSRIEIYHTQAQMHKSHATRRKAIVSEADPGGEEFEPRVVQKSEEELQLLLDCLSRNVIFATMEEDKLREIAAAMARYEVPGNCNIIEQDTLGDNFYVLSRGRVTISVKSEFVEEVGPGGSFGELALLYECPRAATVRSIEPCLLWAVDRNYFKRFIVTAVDSAHGEMVKFLRDRVNVLSNLDDGQLAMIATLLVPASFEAGTKILSEGDPGTTFYIIREGEVAVTRRGMAENLANLGAGEYFGETALMTMAPRTSSVTATSEVLCMVLDHTSFAEHFGSLKALLQRQQIARVLSEIKTYKSLPTPVIQRVLNAFQHLHSESGSIVVEEGNPWPYFCIILEGTVQVCNSTRGLRGEMGPGKWFGDFKTPRAMATIKCKNNTIIARLSMESFQTANMKHVRRGVSSMAVNLGRMQSIDWEDLQMYNTLGVGTFSKVKLTKYTCPRSQEIFWFAMKCVDKRTVVQHGAEQQIMNELHLIQQLNHPLIIGLSATFKDQDKLYLLTELVQGGEFFNYIANKGVLRNEEAQFYGANVLLAIEHMHNNNIIYRDLKPENIVMATNGYLKLVDLGFAKKMDNHMTYTVCGTPDYIAPEIVASKGHNKAVDYWSLGVLIYEMLTGLTPYYDPNGNVFQIYERIINERLQFPPEPKLSGEVKALISSLLFVNPSRRLGSFKGGALDVKDHSWFRSSIDFLQLEARQIKAPYKPPSKRPEVMIQESEIEAEEVFHDNCAWDPEFDMLAEPVAA